MIVMEPDDVQNEIVIETADDTKLYFHRSALPVLEINRETVRNIKSEINENLINAYFGNGTGYAREMRNSIDDSRVKVERATVDEWNENVFGEPENMHLDRIGSNLKEEGDRPADHNYDNGFAVENWNENDFNEGGVADVSEPETEGPKEANSVYCYDVNIEICNHPADGSFFNCRICGKSYNRANLLKSHIRVHFQEKKFTCDICLKSFAISNHLKNHHSVHTGEKKYKCPTCFKCFKQKGHLFYHLKTHTGVKNYSCPMCCKKFTQNIHMKNHLKTHTGEKNYLCRICFKQFTQSGHLQMHMAVHTGERKYQCEYCNMRFKQSGHLFNHRKIHTIQKKKKSESAANNTQV